MAESLQTVKDRLKSRFLGKAGVHGFGISQAQNAIRVYLNSDPIEDSASVLAEIEKEAGPYKVIVVREGPPSIS